MKLYGTLTSPFVRRVRVVGELVGAPLEMVLTSTDEGQAALRAIAPLWKVPVLETGEQTLFDSHVISAWLLQRFGDRAVRTESGPGRWREANILGVVDGALDSAINVFYLERDGIAAERASYVVKQKERVASALGWVEQELDGAWLTGDHRLGLTEIALVTTLEWMVFRNAYDVRRHPGLARFLEAHAASGPFATTRPVG